MRRICLRVEYDGTDFAGWQRQPNVMTVQEQIERNLKKITKETITLHASGRTDSGVHARGQIAHFDTNVRMPAEKFTIALNCGLPDSIRIRKSWEVSDKFHARFSAKRKHYRYCIENVPIPSALGRLYQLHVYHPLSLKRMQEASQLLVGTHDFASFTAIRCPIENTVRTLYQCDVTKTGDLFQIDVIGNGFLFNMVRIIAGTLIEIGKGTRPIEDMERFLAHPDKMMRTGSTAPAHGLTLMDIFYDEMDAYT